MLRFGSVSFDDQMLSARLDEEGRDVRFTRSERVVLDMFIRNPGRLLTRNQLLDVIGGEGSDASDRRIDFLINRLRAKLGDPARSPRLIETRYGEGYVWIAERQWTDLPQGTLLLIGPVYGLESGAGTAAGRRFLDRLQVAFRALAAPDQPVILLPGYRSRGERTPGVQFMLEISLHELQGEFHAAALLRDATTHGVVAAERLRFRDGPTTLAEADHLAGRIHAAIWQRLARGASEVLAPGDAPLYVRLHEAGRRFAMADQSWIAMETQLRAAGAETSDDAELALMWGMHLYAKLLFEGGATGITPEQREAIADEIERRAFASLPQLADRPLLQLGAAKLLFFVGRGHDELAEALAEQAFAQSTAFAAAFAMLGQIGLFRGDTQRAIHLFDKGIELAERGTDFHFYLLTFKLTAQLAAGDRAAMLASWAQLCALNPRSLFDVGPFIADSRPDGMDPRIEAAFSQFDLPRVRGAVAYLFFIMGRYFRVEAQRERVMGGIVYHAMRRFGVEAVPEEVRRSVPRLLAKS